MADLIIPSKPQSPKPGIQINVTVDGPAVVVQTVTTAHLSAADAEGLARALSHAARQADAFNAAVIPLQGVNGSLTR